MFSAQMKYTDLHPAHVWNLRLKHAISTVFTSFAIHGSFKTPFSGVLILGIEWIVNQAFISVIQT